jgi:predicted nucleic acid-binding protein
MTQLNISSRRIASYYAGAYHADDPAPLLQKIADLLEDVEVLDFDHACADRFGQIRGTPSPGHICSHG